jgi:hypothetical protein
MRICGADKEIEVIRLKKALYLIVVLTSIGAMVSACCTYTPTVMAYNEETTGTSHGCGVGGGYLYQSFLASSPQIESIELLLRMGGSFPSTGYTTRLTLRDCRVDGSVLAEASATVTDPATTGGRLYVLFEFPEPISVPIGRRCIIQWESPSEGGSVFTWMGSSGNTYPDGNAFGCTGNPIYDEDRVFRVNPLN